VCWAGRVSVNVSSKLRGRAYDKKTAQQFPSTVAQTLTDSPSIFSFICVFAVKNCVET